MNYMEHAHSHHAPANRSYAKPGYNQNGRRAPATQTPTAAPPSASTLPPIRFTSRNAPPLPDTREEMQAVLTVAEQDSPNGLQAVGKLRYWSSKLHEPGYQLNDVERELAVSFRLPNWYKEKYSPQRLERNQPGPSGATKAEPRPQDKCELWLSFLTDKPALLPRHVKRDAETKLPDPLTVRGYVWANRFATLELSAVATADRKSTRNRIFRALARLFRDPEHYTSELDRLGVVPSATLSITSFPGPFPPSPDDIVRHAAQCGITLGAGTGPGLTAWAVHYHDSTLTHGENATAPPAPNDGSGASTPGDEHTASAQPVPPCGASTAPSGDVEMQDSVPQPDEVSTAGETAS